MNGHQDAAPRKQRKPRKKTKPQHSGSASPPLQSMHITPPARPYDPRGALPPVRYVTTAAGIDALLSDISHFATSAPENTPLVLVRHRRAPPAHVVHSVVFAFTIAAVIDVPPPFPSALLACAPLLVVAGGRPPVPPPEVAVFDLALGRELLDGVHNASLADSARTLSISLSPAHDACADIIGTNLNMNVKSIVRVALDARAIFYALATRLAPHEHRWARLSRFALCSLEGTGALRSLAFDTQTGASIAIPTLLDAERLPAPSAAIANPDALGVINTATERDDTRSTDALLAILPARWSARVPTARISSLVDIQLDIGRPPLAHPRSGARVNLGDGRGDVVTKDSLAGVIFATCEQHARYNRAQQLGEHDDGNADGSSEESEDEEFQAADIDEDETGQSGFSDTNRTHELHLDDDDIIDDDLDIHETQEWTDAEENAGNVGSSALPINSKFEQIMVRKGKKGGKTTEDDNEWSGFDEDNRGGLPGTLHRLSVLYGRGGHAVGLTLRIGRHIGNISSIIHDVLTAPSTSPRNVLIVGRPGSGKTTLVRDAARLLATTKRVMVVDSSDEIGGPGPVPHACIGDARRMSVLGGKRNLAGTLLEAIENHTPDYVIADELSSRPEVAGVSTARERGVAVLASAHGSLRALIRNPVLRSLVGGVERVTLGDAACAGDPEAKVRNVRAFDAVFDTVVELVRRGEDGAEDPEEQELGHSQNDKQNGGKHHGAGQQPDREGPRFAVRIIRDVQEAVDCAMAGRPYWCEMRWRGHDDAILSADVCL